MMKYLVLISLFLTNSFNAQDVSYEKIWQYYGTRDQNDFNFMVTLFSGNIIVSPVIDRYKTTYPLKWGWLDTDGKISPLVSSDPIELDRDKKSKISIDFINKESLNRIKEVGGSYVLYVTPRFEIISDFNEYHTGVLLEGYDVFQYGVLKCRDYLIDNMNKQNYNQRRNLGSTDNIHVLMDTWYKDCLSKNLKDKINERIDEWGILKRRKWNNW